MSIDKNTLNLSEFINPNLISIHLQAQSKLDAIEELSDLLFQNHYINDKKAFVEDVLFRETEGLTGIGNGVAIPHGKSVSVENTTIAIGLSNKAIEWEALDDEPVTAIFLFAVRDQDSNILHLKLLQKIATLLAHEEFVEALHKITSKEELIQLLLQ